jgi:nucleotide-binding universal stress UspA family protein
MGAFSRPRFVEGIFGGVTKRMLKESPIPLFIAH